MKNNLDEIQKTIEAEIFKFISEKIAHYHYKFNEAAWIVTGKHFINAS